jgi:hypothetical protein
MLGALGRGKSAWLETVGSICYRPLILSGASTDKAIVRRLNLWHGTGLIDEADFKTLYSFITKILNLGYDKKSGTYQRVDDIDPEKTLEYQVYGPKLLATRRPYKDMALESRCITTVARKKTKPMPLFRMKRFDEQAQTLRNKLILGVFASMWKCKRKPQF